MTLIDYIGTLIPIETMTPEMQVMLAGCILAFMLRIFVGGFLGFFEKVFHG